MHDMAAQMRQFLTDFAGVMGEHFASLGQSKATPAPVDPEQERVTKALADPKGTAHMACMHHHLIMEQWWRHCRTARSRLLLQRSSSRPTRSSSGGLRFKRDRTWFLCTSWVCWWMLVCWPCNCDV